MTEVFTSGRRRCARFTVPLVITPKDKATIGVTIANTHVRPTTLRIRSHIAEGSLALLREDIQQIALEPGEKETLSWPIFMEDAAYRLYDHSPSESVPGGCPFQPGLAPVAYWRWT